MASQDYILSQNTEFREDYTHSANSLFHFMKKQDYLFSALKAKALKPRYCRENIDYLGLSLEEEPFKEMAVLMKCFCDIPLHRVLDDAVVMSVAENSKRTSTSNRNHASIYGEYALAFSKTWGERHDVQPITYLNPNAYYTMNFRDIINQVLSNTIDLPSTVIDNYLLQLAFFKPLRGSMQRNDEVNKHEYVKNFHDEQEWRFVPKEAFLNEEFDPIIAHPLLLSSLGLQTEDPLDLLSKRLSGNSYENLWLKFEFDDVRYILVPDKQSRLDFINFITAMSDADFSSSIEKQVLISKILILEEIRKDW